MRKIRYKYQTEYYRIHVDRPELPSGHFRAAFLTDLHNKADEKETEILLQMVKDAGPDLLLCGGDMLVGKTGYLTDPAAEFVKKLAAVSTVYYGTGNHEYRLRIYPEQYGDMYPEYREKLADAAVVFLENQVEDLRINGIPVRLAGYDMKRRYYKRFRRVSLPCVELRESVGRPAADAVNILLAHNPAYLKTYLAWGADLSLSGHYHGGVIRFGKRHGVISPDLRFFTGKAHGLFQRDGKSAIVSSGCGEHTIPIRFHNPRELVVVDVYVNTTDETR